MEFRVLGPLEAVGNSGPVALGTRKQRTLLAILACRAGRLVPRETLLDLLWGDPLPSSATTNLRVYVRQLRAALGADAIGHGRHGYLLDVDPDTVDARRFERLLDEAEAASKRGYAGPAATLLGQALDLWRGRAFQEFGEVPLLRDEAARLAERQLVAQQWRIDIELAAGRHAELAAELVRLVAAHPFREQFRHRLMLALYRSGRQAEALQVFAEGRRVLIEELGLEPGTALRQLAHRILTGDPDLDRAAAPAGYREPAATPPSRVLPRSLPRDVPGFTGREAELAVLRETGGEGCPVVAIDGMAGVGKTAIAVHAAHSLAASFPSAQLYLDLRGHHEFRRPLSPSSALRLLLRTLGVPAGQIPETVDERAARWRTESAALAGLLVLDDAANTAQVEPLLPGSGRWLTIVTSRRRLTSLDGARVLTLEVLAPAVATTLLARLAGRPVEPALAEVARLCGHLPLAIRIVGAQLRHHPAWSVTEVADALADRRRRLARLCAEGRSVAAAIHRSYAALPPEHRRLFRLLGRYAESGLDVAQAQALCALPADAARGLLNDLVDAHLLCQDSQRRYRFHVLVGLHARELDESGGPPPPAQPAGQTVASMNSSTAVTTRPRAAAESASGPGRKRP